MLQKDLIAAFQYLKEAFRKDGEKLFSRTHSDKTRGKDFNLREWISIGHMEKNF